MVFPFTQPVNTVTFTQFHYSSANSSIRMDVDLSDRVYLGLYAAVGFSDKLRFMTVMIDDLEVIREFPVRECALSSFGNLGHYLGAVNRTIIQVYSCVTFQVMAILKGHNAKVYLFGLENRNINRNKRNNGSR